MAAPAPKVVYRCDACGDPATSGFKYDFTFKHGCKPEAYPDCEGDYRNNEETGRCEMEVECGFANPLYDPSISTDSLFYNSWTMRPLLH